MKIIRSLLFRELRINRKHCLIGVLVVLFLMVFFFLGGYFVLSNNAESTDAILRFAKNISIVFLLCPMVLFVEDKLFGADLNTGWLGYSYALPITPFVRAAVMLARFAVMQLLSMLIGFVGVIGICLIMNVDFQIGYVVLPFVFWDIALLSKTITDFFRLQARTAEEYQKLDTRGHLISISVILCLGYVILRYTGFDVMVMLLSDTTEPLSFDFLPKLTGEMLIWIIPLTLALCAVYFFVVYYRLQFAYLGGIRIKKTHTKEEKVNLTVPHSEPVGFLYKELKQNRKSILGVISLPFAALLFLAAVLTIVSLRNSYGGDGWIIRTLTSDKMRILSIVLGYFCVGGLLLNVFHGEGRKLWAYFTASTPNGVNKSLYTKYVLSFAMCGLYFVSSYVAETLVATMRWFTIGEEAVSYTGILVLLFFFLLFQNSFSFPLMFRFGEKKGTLINLIIMLGLAILIVLLVVFVPEEVQEKLFKWLVDFSANSAGLFPFISIGAYILSYKVSCKLFMKGVNEYDK